VPALRLSLPHAPSREEVEGMSVERLIEYLQEAIEVAKEYRNRYLSARKRLRKVCNYLFQAESELKTVRSSVQLVDKGSAERHLESALNLLRKALEEVVEA